MIRITLAALAALLLAGCGAAGTATEVRVETIRVPVPTPCPDKATYEALRAKRPVRLAQQPMPATKEERVAKTTAQLGLYEAPGALVDQVFASLARCQEQ